MATYSISPDTVRKRKLGILWNALWGVFMAAFLYLDGHSIVIPIVAGLIFGAFMLFVGWWHKRFFLSNATKHSLTIEPDKLVSKDPGTKSEISFDVVKKFYVHKKRGKIRSITICHTDNVKERLPPYSDMDGILTELEEYAGKEKISYRRWFVA